MHCLKRYTSRRNLLQAALALLVEPVLAQPVLKPVPLGLFDHEQPAHELDDRLVTVSDTLRYRLFRAVPKASPPERGWPALWLLDGNAMFDRLSAELLASFPRLLIIGVGYDTPLAFDTQQRALDYVPGPLRPDPRKPDRQIGQAEIFLERLVGPLRRSAENGLSIDTSRRTLCGHSYGGLFTLHTHASSNDGFSRFCAISPSLWLYANGDFTESMRKNSQSSLTIAIGENEKHVRARSEADKDMANYDALQQLLEGKTVTSPEPATALNYISELKSRGNAAHLIVLPGLDHGATLAAALPIAMNLANT